VEEFKIMNKCIMIGNLCKTNELRYATSGTAILKNSIAVSRNFVKQGEERQSDFINILAFGKTAEFVAKYFDKGSKIALTGEWRTGSYDKDGVKIYTNELLISDVEFVEKKTNNTEMKPPNPPNGFLIEENEEDPLPF
jgi:single-strand DNA-binding protein